MAAKIHRLKIIVALTVAISFAIVMLAPSPVVPATACHAESDGAPLYIQDFSVMPQPLIDDAAELATELFGKNQKKSHDFVSQLLAIYLEAKDKDVIVIFNSGGFGWTPIEEAPGGQGFAIGIESELAALGYSSLLLDHFRTTETLNGCLSEFMAEADLYPSRAKDLASRVEFLTGNIPGIRIILVGQSNGAGICERVMRILKDNQQIYSIQLGPPFWNDIIELDRSLVLKSNGLIPDAFSHGDITTIIRANLESIFGISEDNQGKILLYIGAPGHDYSWEYESVRSQVIDFLDRWFENQ